MATNALAYCTFMAIVAIGVSVSSALGLLYELRERSEDDASAR